MERLRGFPRFQANPGRCSSVIPSRKPGMSHLTTLQDWQLLPHYRRGKCRWPAARTPIIGDPRICKTLLATLLEPPCCQPRLPLPLSRVWRARNQVAPAVASAMMKSRFPARAKRRERLNPQGRHETESRKHRAARRGKAAVRVAAEISTALGLPLPWVHPAAAAPSDLSSPAAVFRAN